MKINHVADGFAVAPQIQPEDAQRIADAGYRTIICNRPDGEEPGQPPLDAIRAAAEGAGLAFHHIPVGGGEFPQSAIDAFAKLRTEAEGGVLAYCRTGTRSVTLDALANIEGLGPDERIARAAAAGYDLSALRCRLR